jgi:hypothetical protein
MIELTVLIVSIVIILAVLSYKEKYGRNTKVEKFQNYYLTACPPGYKTFYNNDGNVVCCDGEVIANKCLGDRQCVLTGAGPDMPNCVDSILQDYQAKSKTQCSASMPNYFEDRSKNLKGCTNGAYNDTLSGPQNPQQPVCKIYSDWNSNQNSADSCYNQQLLDKAVCFGSNCTKSIVQPIQGNPVLIAIGFTDNTGIHRTTYTRDSMENFLNVSNPNWRSQGIDLDTNINVAEVAKAYYIDRTMEQNQVQF